MTPQGTEPSAAGESTISFLVLRGLLEAVERAGVQRATFLSSAQLDLAQLESSESRIPRSEMFRLCEVAIDLTGDLAFGLHWVERLSERMFAPVSHLIAHCSTLRQGLELLAQFFRLLGDDAPYRIQEDGENVTIHCVSSDHPSLRITRFEAEMLLGGFWKLVRTFNLNAQPETVSFAYPAPPYHAEYTRLFKGLQRFDQPFTGLVFDGTLLNAPAPQKDDDVREALQALAERRLLRVTHNTPYSTRVREFVVREGWPHRTDMQSVARSLDISVRSLRRRLEGEGKPYNEILGEALAIVAKQLLQDQRRTIQEIAYEMGFSDPSTFHRAFKRWTGTTPSAYREELLNKL
jgi:AraC-like DNA-binding protein